MEEIVISTAETQGLLVNMHRLCTELCTGYHFCSIRMNSGVDHDLSPGEQ